MGFRFRRRVTLFPGLRINLSKSGASVSIGGRGATVNYSKRGKRVTVGIPGSGISYSASSHESSGTPATRPAIGGNPASGQSNHAVLLLIVVGVGLFIAWVVSTGGR